MHTFTRRMTFALALLLFSVPLKAEKEKGDPMKISIEQPAPDFELPNQDNRPVKLSSFRGQKNVVIYFYPKDFTPGCTKESCAFQSEWKAFDQLNAVVLGISSDSPSSHAKFRAAEGLKFDLLSDEKKEVRKLYGATSMGGLIPGRVTIVIDKQGVIKHIFSSQTSPTQHIAEARQALEKLP